MPEFQGDFYSIVFIGKQNPQILNHDFLINNKVIPENEEPFKSLLSKKENNKNPFTEYISTPVLTTIRYDNITIVAQENRFQIMDKKYEDIRKSQIIKIVKKYFGELLIYTPLKMGGINISGFINFDNKEDEIAFEKKCGISRDMLINTSKTDDIDIGFNLVFPWDIKHVEISINRLVDKPLIKAINFNYEFKYDEIKSFIKNLDDIDKVYDKFVEILSTWQIKGIR